MRLIDAVPVVRCKNCKHYNTIGCSKGFGWCEKIDRGTSDNFYCAEAAVEMGVQDLRKEESERLEGMKMKKLEQAIAYFEDAIKESDEIIAECSEKLQKELTEQKKHFEVALDAMKIL